MQTALPTEEIFTGFVLKSLRDYSYESLLDSQIPEEIILAILSDFKGQKPVEVIHEILSKLQGIAGEEITLRKYIRQLAVLARLRNLAKQTNKQIQDMGLTYDITKDYLYQEGLAKGEEMGLAKGEVRGEARGEKKGKKEVIIEMLKDGTFSLEKIASLAKVSVDYVKQIEQELKK